MPSEMHAPLTPAEWKIMKIIWRKKACAARDVYEETGRDLGWAPTTAKTVLRRLVDKGYLNTTQVGNSFLYRPARSAVKSLFGAADALLENALEGTSGLLLSYMLRKSKLSASEMARLRALLDEQAPEKED
jgi:BlaI family transcriptional regulator, penicillinase repressor